VARDLTERKKVEDMNRRLLEEKEVRRVAEKAVRARDDFLAIAGHELKTPLSSLLLQLQSMLRSVVRDPAAAKLGTRLQRAVGSGVRLGKLIDQLLDVSRITAGRLRLERQHFNLTELVEQVVSDLAEIAIQTKTPVTVDAAPVVDGTWDRTRLEEVVVNLVSNALKYGRGHPVEVRVAATPQLAELKVIDHGIGIDAEKKDQIFERFERLVDEREFGGFGLGLWICKRIVEASKGRIDVHSKLGEGSTFTVVLPRNGNGNGKGADS
jgi:signal transduction histidine kinase